MEEAKEMEREQCDRVYLGTQGTGRKTKGCGVQGCLPFFLQGLVGGAAELGLRARSLGIKAATSRACTVALGKSLTFQCSCLSPHKKGRGDEKRISIVIRESFKGLRTAPFRKYMF